MNPERFEHPLTRDELETLVDEWHALPVDSEAAGMRLHEYCGLTVEQWQQYILGEYPFREDN